MALSKQIYTFIFVTFKYTDINNIFSKTGEGACELIESDSSIKKKVSKYTKKKTDARSPSMAVVGDTNYIIDKSTGLVFY